MATWANADLLIELLERQLKNVLEQSDERRLFFLQRWLGFVAREPQLAGLARDVLQEVNAAQEELSQRAQAIQADLVRLWTDYGQDIREHPTILPEDADKLQVGFDEVILRLSHPCNIVLRDGALDFVSTSQSLLVAGAVRYWLASIRTRCEMTKTVCDERIHQALERSDEVGRDIRFLERKLAVLNDSLPGVALRRLQRLARMSNPVPPRVDTLVDDSTRGWREYSYLHDDAFADKLHGFEAWELRQLERDEVTKAASELEVHLRLVTHDLQVRVLQGRSRLALVARYAHRCEAYDAEHLRQLVKAGKGKVEDRLTLDFARYLFDQGLTPILNSTIGGLRPDVVHVEGKALFYVEAKQYGSRNARGIILKAYKQVWSTWSRIDKAFQVNEGFLVVFRVAGPLAVLPAIVRLPGLTLHSVLVDISTEGGSREKRPQVIIEETDVLSQHATDGAQLSDRPDRKLAGTTSSKRTKRQSRH